MKMMRFDQHTKQKPKSRKISEIFWTIPGSKIRVNPVPENPGIENLDPARAWLRPALRELWKRDCLVLTILQNPWSFFNHLAVEGEKSYLNSFQWQIFSRSWQCLYQYILQILSDKYLVAVDNVCINIYIVDSQWQIVCFKLFLLKFHNFACG